MTKTIKIGNTSVGSGQPAYLIGEIGINHNGDISIAKKLIDIAAAAGFNAVKFQKRTPEVCVPEAEKSKIRSTPWGDMTYFDYRLKVEFGEDEYAIIDEHCKSHGIDWFVSPWDVPSVDFTEKFSPPCYKVASASITDHAILDRLKQTGKIVILSTGMSTMEEIRDSVSCLDRDRLILMHSTSAYPCAPEELNLRMIDTLKEEFDVIVGYSGHEVGLQTTFAAVALGAMLVERHITIDRNMWGSDQFASVEPTGQFRMVRDIRLIEKALGDGIKQVYESEMPIRQKLRKA